MKKRLMTGILFLGAVFGIVGCGKTGKTGEVGSRMAFNWCYMEDGIVYQNPNGGKNRKCDYYDYGTEHYQPLCAAANCRHDTEACLAVRLCEENGVGRFGDCWYYFRSDGENEKGLYSCELDGGNERKICDFPEQPGQVGVYEKGNYYTAVNEIEYDSKGEQIGQNSTIYRTVLSGGTREAICPMTDHDLEIYGIYEDLLLYEEWDEQGRVLRALNLKTKEITSPLGEQRIGAGAVLYNDQFLFTAESAGKQNMISYNLKTGEQRLLMEGAAGDCSVNLYWDEELKIVTLTDYGKSEYPYEVYVYAEDGIWKQIRKGTMKTEEQVLSVKDGTVIGRVGDIGDETLIFDMATISLEDYLAGKSNWKILEY